MANLHKERELGQAAEQILANPIWQEAWAAYRARILEEIEGAPSNGQEQVMHLKRLLASATSARAHMERIMREGATAAKMIELEDRKQGLRKIFG